MSSFGSDGPQYEFNNDQNRIIGGLARRMNIVGTVTMVFAFFTLLVAGFTAFVSKRGLRDLPQDVLDKLNQAAPEAQNLLTGLNSQLQNYGETGWQVALTGLFQGLILLALAVFTKHAAKKFSLVVNTQGNDITHLMGALDAQRRLFGVMATLIVVAVLLVVVSAGLQFYAQSGGQLPF